MNYKLKKAIACVMSAALLFASGGLLSDTTNDNPTVFGICAEATSDGTYGENINWALDDNGTLTISGSGAIPDGCPPWYNSRHKVKNIVISDGVTTIGEGTFNQCVNATTVTIPDSVTGIGKGAFWNCDILESIAIPDKVTDIGDSAFRNCYALETLVIPDSVKNIGDNTFRACRNLKGIKIPDGIKTIGENAFSDCDALKHIHISNKKSYTDFTEFNNSGLPSSENWFNANENNFCMVDECPFEYGLTKKSITIEATEGGQASSSVLTAPAGKTIKLTADTSVGYLFSGWEKIKSKNIEISEDNTFIMPDNDVKIKAVFKENLHEIKTSVSGEGTGELTAQYSRAREGVTVTLTVKPSDNNLLKELNIISKNIEILTDNTFLMPNEDVEIEAVFIPGGKCGNDVSWILENGIMTITGSGNMQDYEQENEHPWFKVKNSVSTIVIDEGVTSIGKNAFSWCSNLKNVIIPGSVSADSIGDGAFFVCNPSHIHIPNGAEASKYTGKGNLPSEEACFFTINEYGFCKANDCPFDFRLEKFKVKYYESKDNKEVESSVSDSPVGKTVTLIPPKSEGYVFKEWKVKSNNVEISADNTFTMPKEDVEIVAVLIPGGKCGEDVSWTLDDGILTITGSGNIQNYSSSDDVPWCNYKEAVTTVNISDTVTGIGNTAFYHCSNLTDITIPGSVAYIGDDAFSGCTSLESITIPESVEYIGVDAFDSCSKLINITIPDKVTSISNSTFSGCSKLTSVKISENVTDIGDYAFNFCSNLKSVAIPDKVTGIGEYAFNFCSSLESITIPDNVTCIEDYTFRGCSKLTSVKISENVTDIGDYAFNSCEKLESISIPDKVTGIGACAFSGCSTLTGITIPESVESIGKYAFSGCSSLTSISIPDSVTYIEDSTFSGCVNLKSVTIPESVESIENNAFNSCVKLESITIPDKVTFIGNYAFCNCTGLKSIKIPDKVTSIGEYAFYFCKNIVSLTLPKEVENIGDKAFYECYQLSHIHISSGKSVSDYADKGNLPSEKEKEKYFVLDEKGYCWERGCSVSPNPANAEITANGLNVKYNEEETADIEFDKVSVHMVKWLIDNKKSITTFVNNYTATKTEKCFDMTEAELTAVINVLDADYKS